MSKYTTGEIAKLCDVSVRTVQYYDTRGILVPSDLTEGGRRLYSESDLKKMKVICFLRNIGMPINTISELLAEENSENVISILLDQQEATLRKEIEDGQKKLQKLEELRREMKAMRDFSVESISDAAYIMENKKKLRKVRTVMMCIGIVGGIIEYGTLLLWIFTGTWWPFAVGMPIVLAACGWLIAFYYKNVDYICPECHSVFKPRFKEMLFANHTFSTRKLTCTHCHHKGFCVETCSDTQQN